MSEHFRRAAERAIQKHTDALLNDLDRLALRYDVDKGVVREACTYYACEDLADWWNEYVGDDEL